MKESTLWRRLRPHFTAIPNLDIVRVESTSSLGLPDVNGIYKGVEFWLELKVAQGDQVEFRPGQIPWLERRCALGGKVYLLVYTDGDLILYKGSQVRAVRDNGIKASPYYEKLDKTPWNIPYLMQVIVEIQT